MNSVAQTEGKTDMVVTVYWTCTAEDVIDGFTYTGSVSDSTPIPYIVEDPWIDYQNLTPADALAWCWEHGVNRSYTEMTAQAIIDSTPKPPVQTKPLPW